MSSVLFTSKPTTTRASQAHFQNGDGWLSYFVAEGDETVCECVQDRSSFALVEVQSLFSDRVLRRLNNLSFPITHLSLSTLLQLSCLLKKQIPRVRRIPRLFAIFLSPKL